MITNPTIKWIPVTQTLPHVNERVLVVCINLQNHMQSHVSICEYWGKDNPSRTPMWSGYKHVTHWSPLPELPKLLKGE